MKKSFLALISGILLLTLVACSGGTDKASESTAEVEDKKTTLKIGTHAVSKDLADSGKEELEKLGYQVEIVVFDDYVLPNDSLVEGSTDANCYQHEPYMKNYNNSHNSDIVMLSPKLYNYYTGFYSDKSTTVEGLPDGGIVGISFDAANIHNDLGFLQQAGIIKLSDQPSAGEFYTIADIIENPKNYQFVQSDHTRYQNIDDYTFYIGTSNTMAANGADPTKNIIKKFVNDEYAQGISVDGKNKDTKWAKDIMTAYTSENAKSKVPATTGFEPFRK